MSDSHYSLYLNKSSLSKTFRIIAKTENFPIVFMMTFNGRFLNFTWSIIWTTSNYGLRYSRFLDFGYDEKNLSGRLPTTYYCKHVPISYA